MVYDLGGGTLNVSILKLHEDRLFKVLATGGNEHLGGADFDKRLVDHCMGVLKEEYNMDISNDIKAKLRLSIACESAKAELSEAPLIGIIVNGLLKGDDFSYKAQNSAN